MAGAGFRGAAGMRADGPMDVTTARRRLALAGVTALVAFGQASLASAEDGGGAAVTADMPVAARAELGSEIAVVFPDVVLGDRRALLASFIDRLGPSCLQKWGRYADDPAAFAPTAWSRGFYRWDESGDAYGGTVGLEAHPNRHACAGFGFNYANTDLSLDGLPQSGEAEAFSFGAYGRGDGRLLFIDGAAAATYGTIESRRSVGLVGQTARGSSDTVGAGFAAGIGIVLRAGAFTLEPRIGLEYDINHQGSLTERGAGIADLRIASQDHEAFRSNVGTRLNAIWQLGSGASFMPEFSVAWAHDLIDQPVSVRQRMAAADNVSFVVAGEPPDANTLLVGAGASYHPNGTDEIFVRYDGRFSADVEGSAVTAGGKFRW